jgi:ubiquinone/menaquinone biosynthesis C-methylase UbiE
MNAALNTAGFAHPPRNVAALRIEHGMHIADFGAGSGAYVMAIADRLEHSGKIYAIDVQQELLRRIKNEAHKKGYKNVEIIWSDIEKPKASKIADRHLDLVLISNLLFQLDDKRAPLLEAWRILKPLGRLAIIDWSESFGGMGPTKKHVVKKDDAKALALSCGFEFTKEFDAGAHHYGLIFRPVAQRT